MRGPMKHCPVCARSFPPEERFCSIHGLPLVDGDSRTEQKGEHTGIVLDDRYLLGGMVGRGGMGIVYDAEHLRIGRRCAIKVLHGARAADPKMQMRLFREVRATSRIRHPNVVEILDYGEHDRVGSFIVMEFLEGTTLSRRIGDGGALPLQLACSVMVQLCSALSATHGRGLIHRDLKPGNVMLLENGRIKVLDFGLVKPIEGGATCEAALTLTSDSVVMGTPCYMSPEHARGELIDARADVYSLGVIFYEMLVGKPPFDGATALEIIERQLGAPVPLPSTLDPPVVLPSSVEWTLLKALHKDRAGRYQSAAELADALYQVAEEQRFRIIDLLPASELGPDHRSSDGAPRRETMRWIGASPLSPNVSIPVPDLSELARSRQDDIVKAVLDALFEAFPRFHAVDRQVLRRRVARMIDAAIDTLGTPPGEKATWELGNPVVEAPEEELTLTEVITAVWLAYTVWRPLLVEAAKDDLQRFVSVADLFDKRILPYFFHIVDSFISIFQGRMQRLNQTLARQNEELQELRVSLSQQVEQAGRQLAEAERLKARVAQTVPSGILLFEKGTGRVLLWNAAMERLSGLSASHVIGVPIDHVASLVEGLPFDEFAEQLRFHGEVGLRKLRIHFKGQGQRTVFVKGKPFEGAGGEQLGTLFVVDDVTEREQVIESLGRYLSKDVVERVLTRAGPTEPEVRQRRAVVLAVRMDHDGSMFDRLDPEGVLGVFGGIVRAVSQTIFPRGGGIERISHDGCLAFFARVDVSCAPALEAAVDLAARLEQIRARLVAAGEPGPAWRLGLHLGDVLVLNAGDEHLMAQTIAGEVTRAAEALCAAATGGEVLISSELLACADVPFTFVAGPDVSVAGRADPIRSHRLAAGADVEAEDEPVTATSRPPTREP